MADAPDQLRGIGAEGSSTVPAGGDRKNNRHRGRTIARKVATGVLLAACAGGAALLCFEVIYRLQLIDTYAAEIRSFNTREDLTGPSSGSTILLMGDSFTAGIDAYPAIMRRALAGVRVINAGISGTGIVEARLTARNRFAKFEPNVLVYQVYVGNDLFNITYPVNWLDISPVRNMYWMVAQRLRPLAFLNYRAGQWLNSARGFSTRQGEEIGEASGERSTRDEEPGEASGERSTLDEEFSIARYTVRDRIYLRAEPDLLQNTIFVRGDRASDYQRFLTGVRELLSLCKPTSCARFLLVVPHQAQVHRRYLENTIRIGASFDNHTAVLQEEYPFITGIRRFLSAEGMSDVVVLNPWALFRASEARGEPVYYANDSHLNQTGQSILAEFVLANVCPEQVPPGRRPESGREPPLQPESRER